MQRENSPTRKYEEYAYVLDFNPRGKSTTVRGREGIIITAIGEDRLTLLEILGTEGATFEMDERIYIGKEGRTKVQSVLGKMEYERISAVAQSELPTIVEQIVVCNEQKFVDYMNRAQPLTPRIHALELIPGVGKTYMKTMLDEREREKFASYKDLEERVGFKDPTRHITERIMDEVTGKTRMNIFVKK
ncbi:MAG: DUF655 domain-containing protein [Nitrosopumilus sp. B06]|nr:MAG: DUF655 domain-containing protein [Nitrosopumilus sp. D6]RNJ79889.1 MAG: DUF655 domain-containing protein [Nitrosopumilus sp. B06]